MKETGAMPEEDFDEQDRHDEDAPAKGDERDRDDDRDDLGDKGKRAIDRMKARVKEAERRATEHADAARELAELKDRDKSEVQRATDRITALERELAARTAEGLRFKIAAQYGIDSEDAELFLTASNEESLTRQAERLKEREKRREEEDEDRLRRSGNRVPREGHGVSTHDDADANALSILGFGD